MNCNEPKFVGDGAVVIQEIARGDDSLRAMVCADCLGPVRVLRLNFDRESKDGNFKPLQFQCVEAFRE